jgi:hypothetical protein
MMWIILKIIITKETIDIYFIEYYYYFYNFIIMLLDYLSNKFNTLFYWLDVIILLKIDFDKVILVLIFMFLEEDNKWIGGEGDVLERFKTVTR